MRKIKQEEFDALDVIDGRKQCPTADYSLIHSFGRGCSFGEWCSFGSRFGSKTYFFNTTDGIYVRCGCFSGTIEQLSERCVGEGKADYLKLIEFVKSL